MFEEEDRETGYAVFLAITLAIVVSLFVIAIAIGQAVGQSGGKPGRAMTAPAMLKVIGLVEFDAGKADPPDDLPMLLNPSLRAAMALPASKLVVAAYFQGGDAGGEALAKQRAGVVRDALVAGGVKASRVIVASPAVGSGSTEEMQRVEVTLR